MTLIDDVLGRKDDVASISDKQSETNATAVLRANEGVTEGAMVVKSERKSLTDINLSDIKVSLDNTKSYEQQAEDVVGMMATVGAIQDAEVAEKLTQAKAEELTEKAHAKASKAKTDATNADTEQQEAKRKLYEAVLETFAINKHLPNWLMVTLVILLSPLYIIITFAIGTPCAIAKIFIDNVDGIIVSYNKSDTNAKPKIKVAFWLIVAIIIVFAVLSVLRNYGVKI